MNNFIEMKKNAPLISIIIPSLNDSKWVNKNIKDLKNIQEIEIIVVEAGNNLAKLEDCYFIRSSRANRAYQMNLGAKEAKGELLLFLHADTLVRAESVLPLHERMKKHREYSGGAFQFALDSSSWKARGVEWGVKLREIVFKLPYGDQGVFVWKKVFEEIGGYPDVPILEDVLLIQKLKMKGKLFFYPEKAITSARKWEQRGYLKMTLMNWMTMIRWKMGASLEELVRVRSRVEFIRPHFRKALLQHNLHLIRNPLEILQVNLGKFCNQACHHCHVEAGPTRKEMMERKTVDRILKLLDRNQTIHTVDITGGAPELNPYFRYLVEESKRRRKIIIDRCNLTVLFQKGQQDTAEFLRDQRIKVIASLPCYLKENVDKQRGSGVFEKSIRALRLLNELGFGKKSTGLTLDLVYNPVGPYLPPPQSKLEADYKEHLKNEFGIEFNHLYTITNMPIKRFLEDLEQTGKLEEYMTLLVNSFNPQAALSVMCRNMVSIGWDGQIYDCDFNQMLEIPSGNKRRTIWEVESFNNLGAEEIAFADHCYGCTAGAGSSCGGALI
jgi:rSAM/selenodomain-associated transferase 2